MSGSYDALDKDSNANTMDRQKLHSSLKKSEEQTGQPRFPSVESVVFDLETKWQR